jgi:hypothetical protein
MGYDHSRSMGNQTPSRRRQFTITPAPPHHGGLALYDSIPKLGGSMASEQGNAIADGFEQVRITAAGDWQAEDACSNRGLEIGLLGKQARVHRLYGIKLP